VGAPFPAIREVNFMRTRSVVFLVLILIAVLMPEVILGFIRDFLDQLKDAVHQATAG
jgi:hypothetical protein